MALGSAGATAQPVPAGVRPAAPVGPWHKGVSTQNKTRALALYNVGNTYFAKSQWSTALLKYAAAVKLWDHPGIRYNMAKCLMELKRYLEANHSLKLALRYGAAPLDPPRLYQEGKFLLGMLGRLLARVRIVCRQPGVRVTLDGQLLFVGPGEKTRLMDPAKRHVVVATKTKHITVTRTLAPLPGRLTVVTLQLIRLKKTLVMKRRWARWIPWTVLAVGVAVAAVGAPFTLAAVNGYKDYDDGYTAWCRLSGGCYLPDREPELVAIEDKARVNRAVGITILSLGSATVAAGIVLILLNIPHTVSPKNNRRPSAPRITLLPSVHRGGGSVALRLRF